MQFDIRTTGPAFRAGFFFALSGFVIVV